MRKTMMVLGILLSFALVLSVSTAWSGGGGGSGEGDDCVAELNYKNIGGPYKGTLMGWQNELGKILLCTPDESPLVRSNSDCTMTIPCDNPYIFGSFNLPTKPKDMTRWCRWGLGIYVDPLWGIEDQCDYGAHTVAGYESIDASKPKYSPDGSTFTVDIVIMPMYISY